VSHFDPHGFGAPEVCREIIIPDSYEPTLRVQQFFDGLREAERQGEAKYSLAYEDLGGPPHVTFATANKEITPGVYTLELVPLLKTMSTKAVLEYLRSRRAALLGVHGLILLIEEGVQFSGEIASFAPRQKKLSAASGPNPSQKESLAAPTLFHRDGLYFMSTARAAQSLWTRQHMLAVFVRQ
jgi:hypothetical protein